MLLTQYFSNESHFSMSLSVNTFWPSDTLWQQRFGSLGAWLHQAIIWTTVHYSLVRFVGIHMRAILQQLLKLLFSIVSLKIILFKLLPHFPWANELCRPSLPGRCVPSVYPACETGMRAHTSDRTPCHRDDSTQYSAVAPRSTAPEHQRKTCMMSGAVAIMINVT